MELYTSQLVINNNNFFLRFLLKHFVIMVNFLSEANCYEGLMIMKGQIEDKFLVALIRWFSPIEKK